MAIPRSKDRQKPLGQHSAEELRALAESRFRSREQSPDVPKAMHQYREAKRAVIDRMIQLRAERLARETVLQNADSRTTDWDVIGS